MPILDLWKSTSPSILYSVHTVQWIGRVNLCNVEYGCEAEAKELFYYMLPDPFDVFVPKNKNI